MEQRSAEAVHEHRTDTIRRFVFRGSSVRDVVVTCHCGRGAELRTGIDDVRLDGAAFTLPGGREIVYVSEHLVRLTRTFTVTNGVTSRSQILRYDRPA